MRIGIVVLGVVLLIIGAVLMLIPLSAQSPQTVNTSSTLPFEIVSISGFSLTGSIPVSISWTSTGTVTVLAAACSATCTANASSISGVTTQTGSSGTISLNQPDGGTVIVGAIDLSHGSQNVTFNMKTALTTVGSILVIVGIVVLIVGAILKSKSAKMASPPPMMPAEPAGTAGSPPPGATPPTQ